MAKIVAKIKSWHVAKPKMDVMQGKNWNIPVCGPFYEEEIRISKLIAI